jgi:DNA-binding CsgD family transcriptional regulator
MPQRLNDAAELTARQREVLALVARGKTNFEIATQLGITLDGAKWHIREIMAKLGCDSREEAVAIWRQRRSVRQRVARALGPVGPHALARFAAGGAGVAAIVAVASIVLATHFDDAAEATPAPRVTPTADATATPAASSALPLVTSHSAVSGPIPFRSCGTTSFTRPAIAEMASAFHNPRFGGTDQRPGPLYYKYYLANVYRIVPRAISANVENVAMSGVQLSQNQATLIPPAAPCDQAFRQDYALDYYEFWFVDMVPKAVSLDGNALTITADELRGSFTDFVFPDPPLPAPPLISKDAVSQLPPFSELRVQAAEGGLLYSNGALGEARYSPDGNLVFATDGFGGGQVEFDIIGHAQSIVIYTSFPSNGVSELTDANGRVWTSDATSPAPGTWAEVFRRELPVGRYRVGGGGVLIVPVGTTLP